MDARIAGKTSFLDVSVRVFLKEISIGIGRLSNSDGYHPTSRGPEWNKKTKEEQICSLFELFSFPQMLGIGTSGSWAFGLRLSRTTSFLGSPACEQQTLGPMGLHSHVSQNMFYWFRFFGEP